MTEGPVWLAEAATAADQLGGSGGQSGLPPGKLFLSAPSLVGCVINVNLPYIAS